MRVSIRYFVHSITTDNERGIATGWLPGKLSEEGEKRARALKGQLANMHFDGIFCSDLERAKHSARLFFGDTAAITPDARLRECDYGDYTGKPSSQFASRKKDFIIKRFPHGESYKDVEARMADFLHFLAHKYQGTQVAIVAHQVPQFALDVLLKGKTWPQAIDEDWRKRNAWQPGWDYTL